MPDAVFEMVDLHIFLGADDDQTERMHDIQHVIVLLYHFLIHRPPLAQAAGTPG
jgi:hypothetical protein